jgi:hypothetical protein
MAITLSLLRGNTGTSYQNSNITLLPPPQAGQTTDVNTTVWNSGSTAATNVTVKAYAVPYSVLAGATFGALAGYAVSPGAATNLGTIQPNQSGTALNKWKVGSGGPYCVIITVSSPADPLQFVAGTPLLTVIQDRHAGASNYPPPPKTATDAFTANAGMTTTFPAPGVLVNDTLNGAAMTTLGSLTTAHGGKAILNADGSFAYTPPSGFTGSDSFTYRLANAGGSAIGSVTIYVVVFPVVLDSSYTVYAVYPDHLIPIQQPSTQLTVPAPGVLTGATLNGGSIVSYGSTGTEQRTVGASVSTFQRLVGQVTVNADGSFSYSCAMPGGLTDSFVVVIANPGGGSDAAKVTLNVTSSPPPAPPPQFPPPPFP